MEKVGVPMIIAIAGAAVIAYSLWGASVVREQGSYFAQSPQQVVVNR